MSISGISNSYNQLQLNAATNPYQQQFQQLSNALQSGNLSAAQSDFATLQQAFSQSSSTTPSTSATSTSASVTNPIAQAFSQLGSDLQSGNLSAAQKDFSTVQQDIQSQSGSGSRVRHHHSHGGGGGGGSNTQSTLLQDLSQVGQTLTSSNLTGAQQAYSTLQQDIQQFAFGAGGLSSQASTLQDQPLSLVA
jgi:hypothetical protein